MGYSTRPKLPNSGYSYFFSCFFVLARSTQLVWIMLHLVATTNAVLNDNGSMYLACITHYGTVAACVLMVLLLSSLAIAALKSIFYAPLKSYPGPLLARCSRLWYARSILCGSLHFDVRELHDKYGDVVRIAPDELSYSSAQAWKDIYGFRKGLPEVPKDPLFYGMLSNATLSLLGAPAERHGHFRGLLAHGFSEKNMRTQEERVKQFSALFIQGLRDACDGGRENVDLVKWFNFFSFDVTGALVYGKSFDCLTSGGNYHPWIEAMLGNQKFGVYARTAKYFPGASYLLSKLIPSSLIESRRMHMEFTTELALHRRSLRLDQQDLVERMAQPENGVSEKEFIANTSTIVIGGSETTATLMSGLFYYVLRDTQIKNRLTNEIRSAFTLGDSISYSKLGELKYMQACISEALRMYPPFPANFPRRTTRPEMIDGKMVPANTTVSVFHWSTYHLRRNFIRPDDFIPERWLDDFRFSKDNTAVLQPFHLGPRNCIGRTLAYIEIRLLLAKTFLNFDVELSPECRKWDEQKAFMTWDRKPLWVKMTPRVSEQGSSGRRVSFDEEKREV